MSTPIDGLYRIKNVYYQKVIDLSGSDGKTVSGWEDNGGDNQSWVVDFGGASDSRIILMRHGWWHDGYLMVPVKAIFQPLQYLLDNDGGTDGREGRWQIIPVGSSPNHDQFYQIKPLVDPNLALEMGDPTTSEGNGNTIRLNLTQPGLPQQCWVFG